jgi:hypothetical protein
MFPDFCHTEAQACRMRDADALLSRYDGDAYATDDADFKEFAFAPAKIEEIADTRQSVGAPFLADDENDGELFAPERAADTRASRLRQHIARREFFASLTHPLKDADAFERRARKGVCRLQSIRSAYEIEILCATIDEDFAKAGHNSKRRRDLAATLNVSVSTIVTLIGRGRCSLETAIQMAKAAAAEAVSPKADQSISAPPLAAGPTLPNIAQATRGSQFDSRERRAGIAELTVEEQCEFVALIEQQAVEGEIDAADALDRKSRTKLLPHSILHALDDCDRNREDVRRTLAGLDHDERKRLVGEWIGEALDDAIAGSAPQRQAASKRTNREYAEMARAWVKRQRAKTNRQPSESVSS